MSGKQIVLGSASQRLCRKVFVLSAADNQDRYGRQIVAKMLKAIAGNEALLRDAGWLLGVIRELIQCDGIAVATDGQVFTCGATPPTAAIDSLARNPEQQVEVTPPWAGCVA